MSRPPEPRSLERDWESIPDSVCRDHVRDARLVRLPADEPPWTSIDLALEAGCEWSWFATGRVVTSEEAGLWNGPALHLWARIAGGAPLLKGTRDTASFVAGSDGAVELCIYSGEWGSPNGILATPIEAYAALAGGLDVLVLKWRDGARDGLDALAEAGPADSVFATERERLRHEAPTPTGWQHHWLLGPSAIYRSIESEGRAAIRAETSDDVGILQHPVDVPLDADTRVGWQWRIESLPSERAEDTLLTHDYLSVAFEFENGLDLTYLWSSQMTPGSHYRCPLPGWDQREWHQVIRRGRDGLGQWQREERRLLPDTERVIGSTPERIVSVWLISVSVFQKRRGAAEYRDLWIQSGDRRIQVI